MENASALKLLCDTLKKCRISHRISSRQEALCAPIGLFEESIMAHYPPKPSLQSRVGMLAPATMYRYTDEFHLHYIYLSISEEAEGKVMSVGPYLTEDITTQQVLELGERAGIPPKLQSFFEGLFASLPVMPEGSPVFVMLDAFCEQLWQSPSFAIYNIDLPDGVSLPAIAEPISGDNFDDTALNIRTMEMRYQFENELMQAVSLGQLHKEKMLTVSFSEKMFEKRVADPLRNTKNYCIIMNTLLRKAAEKGGVHPVYIDRISSRFALKIEQLKSLQQTTPLMQEMFRGYCRLVRQHSIQSYSPAVQKTVLLIENDLAADLSLTALARQQNLSTAYLSTLFKKETGKTVSEYIREKRMQHAAHLLISTHLQVQTVALYCGILDVQYFSKVFKKQMGMTPKEYREAARQKT